MLRVNFRFVTASARIFHVWYFPTSSKHRFTDTDQQRTTTVCWTGSFILARSLAATAAHNSHQYCRSDCHSHIAERSQPSLSAASLLAHSNTLVLYSPSHRSQQIISDRCMPVVRPWQQKSLMPSRQCAIDCIHATQNTDTTYCRLRLRPTCLELPAKPQYSPRSLGPI